MTNNKYLEKIAVLVRSLENLTSRAGSLENGMANRVRKIAQGLSSKPDPVKANLTSQTLKNQLGTGLFKKNG
jgi:hypothetical protein